MRIDDRESFKYYMQILNIERTLNSSSVKGQKTTARELSNLQIFYSTHRTMKSCRFSTLEVLEEVSTTPHSLWGSDCFPMGPGKLDAYNKETFFHPD